MKKYFLFATILLTNLLVSASSFVSCEVPDSSKISIIDKGKIAIHISDGNHMFIGRDYRGALAEYRAVLVEDPSHAMAHFKIAYCQFNLNNYELAKKYMVKAENLDPEVDKELYYLEGITYHRLGEIDLAIEKMTKFKELTRKKKVLEEYEVDFILKQLAFANNAMANPMKVTVDIISTNINSRYNDQSPIFSSDGQIMYFTSRRQGANGSNRDEGSDHLYYESIFKATWNPSTNDWNQAELMEGKLNTEGHTSASHITADEKELYLSVNIDLATGSGDIWVSKKSSSGKWGGPKPVEELTKLSTNGINTSYYESCPSLTADGQTMYFVSERPKGEGQGDIYMVKRISKNEWGEPVNLGPLVNSFGDENTVQVSPDGNTLYFCSNGHMGMGGYDIFRCDLVNGIWSAPVNVGYPINSVGNDSHFIIAPNGTGYYCSIKKEGHGSRDIYKVDLSNYVAPAVPKAE